MRHFILLLLMLPVLTSGTAAAQNMVIQVAQESAAGAGDFDANVLGSVQAYTTTGTVASYYNYTVQGQDGGYNGVAPVISSQPFRNKIHTFFVVGSDGLGFVTIHGPRGGGGSQGDLTASSTHDVSSGAFTTPLDVQDDPVDSFVFSNANTTLTAITETGGSSNDGFAVRFTDPNPVIFSDLQAFSNSIAGWTIHGTGGTTEATTSVGRRVRFNVSWVVDPSDIPTVADAPGWRLLSAPFGGLDVLDLAAINYVGGVPAGATNAAQYPGGGYINPRGQLAGNLYHKYEGVESIRNQADTADSTAVIYSPVPDSDYTFESGQGIWWYWYDLPFDLEATRGGGIGVSYDLLDAAFSLSASGLPVTADVSTTFPLATVLPATYDGDGDGIPDPTVAIEYFYMGGNPFAAPFNVDGISATDGVVQSLVYTWDPTANSGAGNHVPLARSALLDGSGAFAAVWQGFLMEITPTGSTGPTISYDFESTDGAETPPFYGKSGNSASGDDPLEFLFTLSGENTEDKTWLRFQPDATNGWDAHDASKYSLSSAQIAVSGEGGKRLGMSSLSDGTAAPLAKNVRVKLDFVATDAGTYTLAWDQNLARGWKATLRDRVSGRRVNMKRNSSYTFESDATDWTERFLVRVRPPKGARTSKTGEGDIAVGQPYPNPASGASRMEVVMDEAQDVKVAVYDALGREVAVAHEGTLAAGDHIVALPVATLSAGTYVVRVTGASVAETRRLTVVR